jgi:hypothetical protein
VELFVAYPFSAHWVKQYMMPLLHSRDIRITVGANYQGRPVGESVRGAIARSDALIAFFAAEERIKGRKAWTTSDFVIQEATYAFAKRKRVLEVIEEGVDYQGGLFGDRQMTIFSWKSPVPQCVNLADTIRKWGRSGEPPLRVRQIAKPKKNGFWKWWLWLEGDGPRNVESVQYQFHHRSVSQPPRIEDASNNFMVEWKTYGEVSITAHVHMKGMGKTRALKTQLRLYDRDGNRCNE